jgi:hypothetical protein
LRACVLPFDMNLPANSGARKLFIPGNLLKLV